MSRKQVKDLFGQIVGDFKTSVGRLPAPPFTVWESYLSDPEVRRQKRHIGDSAYFGSERAACLQPENQSKKSCYRNSQSVFNPATAYWIFNRYAPKKGICYDPFAGGGTRAIMAARHGMDYIGIEIRKNECEAILRRAKRNKVSKKVKIICGDSRSVPMVEDEIADFLITCPPYWNVEHYRGGKKDLSMLGTYDEFNKGIQKSINESYRILKKGAISVWVIGLVRDLDGYLQGMNHDTARMHRTGFKMLEEIPIIFRGTPAIQRIGMFTKGNHNLVRVHEYAQIFQRI